MIYEIMNPSNPVLPFIFHLDKIINGNCFGRGSGNWHESIELLYFTEGAGLVICDFEKTNVKAGDVFIVNSEKVHTIISDATLTYYCLIVDCEFFASNGINLQGLYFQDKINDAALNSLFENVTKTFAGFSRFYSAKIRLTILDMLVYIAENYSVKTPSVSDKREHIIEAVKTAIKYIRLNINKNITVDEVLNEIAFSRAYFSRNFKKATGYSIIEYINLLKCTLASKMLANLDVSVQQVASDLGFNNLSYFTKTYKKYIGKYPSNR
ncbi:MAG: AraC family transcriptional regulator [Bacillota bacterium]|nr:AraC family transcriptional regulator [Bacillota bacterium]